MTVDTEQWIRHFKQLHVDTVGLSQTLGDILPDSLPDLTVSGLQYWLMSGRAFQLYQQSSQYFYLNSRLAQQAGARPLLFLRNPDGWCEPPCQQAYCWMRGGTPRVHSQWHDNYRNHMFDWWALLFAGNLDLALKADPSLRMVHIWNEPDIVSVCSCCVLMYSVIITLCTYAQQGYAFGRVGLCVYVYTYICMSTKKQAV